VVFASEGVIEAAHVSELVRAAVPSSRSRASVEPPRDSEAGRSGDDVIRADLLAALTDARRVSLVGQITAAPRNSVPEHGFPRVRHRNCPAASAVQPGTRRADRCDVKSTDVVALVRVLSSALTRPLALASKELAEAELLAGELDRSERAKSLVASLASSRRAIEDARLVAPLLEAVSGRSERARRPYKLCAIVVDATVVVEPALGERARVELAIHSSPWILADWSRVSQLIVRLLRRAFELADTETTSAPCVTPSVIRATVREDGAEAVLEVRSNRRARDGALADVDLLHCRALANLLGAALEVVETGGESVATLRFDVGARPVTDPKDRSTIPPPMRQMRPRTEQCP